MKLTVLLLGTLALAVSACAPAGPAAPPPPEIVRRPSTCEQLEYVLVQDGRTLGKGALSSMPQRPGEWVLAQVYVSSIDTERIDEARAIVTESFAPRSASRLVAQMGNLDESSIEYRTVDDRAVGTITRKTTGRAPSEPAELRLRPHAYDNESSFWLWRALPLAEGYATRYNSVNVYEREQTTVDLTVVGTTEVTVPAGTFEVWRLLVVAGRASRTAWIEVAPPHRLVQWDNGVSFMQLVRDGSAQAPCATAAVSS